jgi:hypothetical protein
MNLWGLPRAEEKMFNFFRLGILPRECKCEDKNLMKVAITRILLLLV